MSVVNRMLQEIDRRRAAAGVETPGAYPDIRSVTASAEAPAQSGRTLWMMALLIGVCALAAIAWLVWQTRMSIQDAPKPHSLAPVPAETSVAPAPAPAPPPAPVESAVSPPPVPAQAAPVVAEATDSSAAVASAAPRNAPRPSIDALKLSLKLSALVADAPAPRSAMKPVPNAAVAAPAARTPAPGKTTITSAPVRQVAADETVLTARAMWDDGARTGAVATLREALAVAEKARNDRATVMLARELARLDVADNRAADARDLLKRLEPLFREDADAWALRGNAEQRLALHTEAAQSYLAALRIRPNEGKWMLGAAISLAAIGQPDEAKIWVARARERGAITPVISAYLQQLGIVAPQ